MVHFFPQVPSGTNGIYSVTSPFVLVLLICSQLLSHLFGFGKGISVLHRVGLLAQNLRHN